MHNANETVLEIDLKALGHNYRYLTSKISPETKVMGVVKAFAYGSDAVAIAKELEQLGVDYLAVAYVKEGVVLRDGGVKKPILVLHPQAGSLELLIERCLEPALYSRRLLNAFLRTAADKSQTDYPVHIKFNTGLNRLGFMENDVAHIAESLSGNKTVKVKSVFSHLAASEDLNESAFTLGQIDSFQKISSEMIDKLGYPVLRHQSNTSAIINYPEAHFDMVRTGIGLYGYGNSPEEDAQLKPVATLKTSISQIHKIEPGESVGYNRGFVSNDYRTTATLPIGHADGIGRIYGNGKGQVLINGRLVPIVGNVCMDMLMVDVTGVPCDEGDEVIVLGGDLLASAQSEAAGTISYELLTAISQRVTRRVIPS